MLYNDISAERPAVRGPAVLPADSPGVGTEVDVLAVHVDRGRPPPDRTQSIGPACGSAMPISPEVSVSASTSVMDNIRDALSAYALVELAWPVLLPFLMNDRVTDDYALKVPLRSTQRLFPKQ